MFYFHPWEIDPGQPRQQGCRPKTRFRHYVNLTTYGGAECERCCAILNGTAWTACSSERPMNSTERPSRLAGNSRQPRWSGARRWRRATVARWDAVRLQLPRRHLFPPRRLERRVIERRVRPPHPFSAGRADGAIVGVLPLAEINSRLFGHSLGSLPFCAYGGIVGRALTRRGRRSTRRRRRWRASSRWAHLEYRNIDAQHADWPTKDLYVTFRKAIDPEVEANMNAIPRKQRAMVRKGIKAGLHSEIDGERRAFLPGLCGERPPARHAGLLAQIISRCCKDVFGDDCEVLTVIKDGRSISSVMSSISATRCCPITAAARWRRATWQATISCTGS